METYPFGPELIHAYRAGKKVRSLDTNCIFQKDAGNDFNEDLCESEIFGLWEILEDTPKPDDYDPEENKRLWEKILITFDINSGNPAIVDALKDYIFNTLLMRRKK